MTEPCKQEGRVSKLEAENTSKDNALAAIGRSLEEMNRLLRVVAEFGADIRHLREDKARHEDDINSLYSRVRSLELAPGRALSKLALLMITTISGCFGGVLTGLILWILRMTS